MRRMFAQVGDQALKAFCQLCLRGWSVSCHHRRVTSTQTYCTSQVFFNMPGLHLLGCFSSPLVYILVHTKEPLTNSKQPELVIIRINNTAPSAGSPATLLVLYMLLGYVVQVKC